MTETERSIDLGADVATLTGDCLVDDLRDLSETVHIVDGDVLDTVVSAIRRRAVRLGELLAAGRSEADLAATLAVGQRAGQQTGVKQGWAAGFAAGKAQAEQEGRKGASVAAIERDEQGRPTAILEERDGTTTRKLIERDPDGRIVRVVAAPL